MALLGFLIVVLHPGAPLTLLGFSVVGLGVALMAPSAFSAAGRSDWPLAMGALTTVFQLGFLLGPVLTGLLSHHWGYAVVFWLPAACAATYLAVGTSKQKITSAAL